MGLLLFKKKFKEDILCGRKTTTLRCWKYQRVREGQTVSTNLGFKLEITHCSQILSDHLTPEIAHADGFDSVQALQSQLLEIYGTLEKPMTLVRFKPPSDQNRAPLQAEISQQTQNQSSTDLPPLSPSLPDEDAQDEMSA